MNLYAVKNLKIRRSFQIIGRVKPLGLRATQTGPHHNVRDITNGFQVQNRTAFLPSAKFRSRFALLAGHHLYTYVWQPRWELSLATRHAQLQSELPTSRPVAEVKQASGPYEYESLGARIYRETGAQLPERKSPQGKRKYRFVFRLLKLPTPPQGSQEILVKFEIGGKDPFWSHPRPGVLSIGKSGFRFPIVRQNPSGKRISVCRNPKTDFVFYCEIRIVKSKCQQKKEKQRNAKIKKLKKNDTI